MKKIILTLLTISLFSDCKEELELTKPLAQMLVYKVLELQQKFNVEVPANFDENATILEREGYINRWTKNNRYEISVNEKAKPYYLGTKRKDEFGDDVPVFKSFNIDFGEITGIAINQEKQTATIRFTLMATGVTPIGKLLNSNIDTPRHGELVFKKFDKGWQLGTDQNKSGYELVRDIWWPKKH